MNRMLIASFASLLAIGLIAPAAQSSTQLRQFQDRHMAGGGELLIEVLFKDTKGGKKGNLTPRRVTLIVLEVLPLRCTPDKGLVASTTMETSIKLEKRRLRYRFDFADSTNEPARIIGKLKRRGKANGSFNIQGLDLPISGLSDCTTGGSKSWSATRCGSAATPSLPRCRVGGGS